MSSISFIDKYKEALVGGRERAFLSVTLDKLFRAIVDVEGLYIFSKNQSIINEVLGIEDRSFAKYYLMSVFENKRTIGDQTFDLFDCCLNTALTIGGDQLKLAARLHGQCEIHCYVEGKNRKWLSDIIEKGLGQVFRKETQGYGKGWEDVISLLRERDDCPVVTSYSVTDSFPNQFITNYSRKKWEKLDEDAKWDVSVKALRKQMDGLLELTPDNWSQYYFGEELNGFDLYNKILREIDLRKTE